VSIVFSEKKAMEFRNAVVERMNAVNGAAQEEVQVQYEDAVVHPDIQKNIQVFSYSIMDIAKHNILSVSVFNIIAVIGGSIGTIWMYLDMGEDVSLGSIFAAAVFVAGLAYNLIKRFITYYNFSVFRMGDDLHLKYGLLKLKNYTVPIDKIAAIKIVQPTLSRIAGMYQVQIITVGLGDEDGELANLVMAMPKEKLIEQMKVLLPEYNVNNFDDHVQKEEKSALNIKAAKSVKWIVIAIGTVLAVSIGAEVPWWISIAAGSAFMVFVASLYMLAHFTAGYFIGDEQLILVDGHFAKEYMVCKYSSIQMVNTTSGPLERRLGVIDGNIDLLNANGMIPYVKPEVAEKISYKVLNS